jgi:hypothetical protein
MEPTRMFRTIASFVKEAALGVAEMLGATFTSGQTTKASLFAAASKPLETGPLARDAGAIAANAACVEAPAAARTSENAPEVETVTPDAPLAAQGAPGNPSPPINNGVLKKPRPAPAAKSSGRTKAAPRKKIAPAIPAAANDGETRAAPPEAAVGEKTAGEAPAPDSRSRVAARYQALKAEGLTAKEANDFSRSEKKYALYLRLSSTRLFDGAKTHWETLKDFDHKGADELARRKASGVPAEEIAILRKQMAEARAELIAKYQADDGPGRNSIEVEAVAKIIGLEHF